MADTAVLRVDVASADFDKFQATFNQYAKTLETTLATWAKITTEVKAASAAMTNMAAPVARSTASLQKFTQQFAETAKHTASIRSNVESITKGLVSWKTAIGSTLALLGIGAGVAGINALISGAVDARNKALAQGMGYGAARGAALMPGGGALMAGWGTARWDPTSGAYRGARTLFGGDTDRQLQRNDPRAFVDALTKATTYLGQFDEKMRGTIAATTGLNDFLGTEALRTFETLTEQAKKGNKAAQEELDTRIKAYTAAGEAAKQAEEGVRKWATFYVTLESSRSVIQDVLVSGLSPLAKPLGELATALSKAVTAFLQTDEVKDTIKRFGDELESWATWLQTKEGQKEFDDFIKNVGAAAKAIAEFTAAIGRIVMWIANSPVGKVVGGVITTLPKAVDTLQKEGLGSFHTGPMTPADIARNARLGRDPLGGEINPDGKTSANFPNGFDQPAVPFWKQKNFGFGFHWNKTPSGFANAAWTPGPVTAASAVGGQDSRMGEQLMQWFGQESMATQKAADAAERRDTKLERLLVSMEKWFQGGEELKPKSIGSMNWGGLASKFAPPAVRGLYNTLNPTPAETGELPQQFWPQSAYGGASGGLRARGTAAGSINAPGSTKASGNLAKNQAEAYQAARSAGLDDAGARALVANMSGEALNKPGDVHWDVSHYAHGIVQWDDKRAAAIQEHFGKAPQDMSVGEQTKAAIWEMQSNPAYKKSWEALHSGGSAESMVGTLVSNYERPRDVGGATATRERFLHGLGPLGGGAAVAGATPNSVSEIRTPTGGNASDANALLAEVKRTHPHFTNEQCVTLVREYTGMGGTVKDWRKGQNALSGNLQVGQPIATFMSSKGQQSERYDAGGIGTPGAGTSHAALFGGYTRDKEGKITGMNVVEQYSGSKGPHVQHYGIGGYGEHGAENYYAIAKQAAKQGPQTAGGLDNDNWQQKPINHVQVHNRSGSDVHIAASTVMTSV